VLYVGSTEPLPSLLHLVSISMRVQPFVLPVFPREYLEPLSMEESHHGEGEEVAFL
jgi:hypothetical protein